MFVFGLFFFSGKHAECWQGDYRIKWKSFQSFNISFRPSIWLVTRTHKNAPHPHSIFIHYHSMWACISHILVPFRTRCVGRRVCQKYTTDVHCMEYRACDHSRCGRLAPNCLSVDPEYDVRQIGYSCQSTTSETEIRWNFVVDEIEQNTSIIKMM